MVPIAATFVGSGDWYQSTVSATRASYVTPPEDHNSGVSKAITANDVQRPLDSCEFGDPAGGGDCAILLLVARLGLRSIEAARLQVNNLNWRAGRIIPRGKASREDGMPRCPPMSGRRWAPACSRPAQRPANRQA